MIYFGDHLFSDLRGPAKAGWRTAAIIHELEVCLCYTFESCIILPEYFFLVTSKALCVLQDEILIQNEDAYRLEQVLLCKVIIYIYI